MREGRERGEGREEEEREVEQYTVWEALSWKLLKCSQIFKLSVFAINP